MMHDEMVEYVSECGKTLLFDSGSCWLVSDDDEATELCFPVTEQPPFEARYLTGYGWVFELSGWNRFRGERGFSPIVVRGVKE